MIKHRCKERIRYADTDQMGVVYYGNYATFFEIGRVELMRDIGISYKLMEIDHGVALPVVRMEVKYFRPAYYDDVITIETIINKLPGRLIACTCNIYNSKEELINTSLVKLGFFDMKEKHLIECPEYVMDILKPYFV